MFLLAALAICVNVNAENGNSTDGGSTDDAASMMINRHQTLIPWCSKQYKKNENLRSMGFEADYVSCDGPNGRYYRARQCSGNRCWCAHLDGTVIPHTTLSS